MKAMLKKIRDWFFGSKKTPNKLDVLREIENAEKLDFPGDIVEARIKPVRPKRKAVRKTTKKTQKKALKKTKKAPKKTGKTPKKTKKEVKIKKAVKKSKKEQVVVYLKPRKTPAKIEEIAKKIGITTQTARRYLYYLKKEKKVVKKGDGWLVK